MNLVFLLFITFNVVLQYKFAIANYLDSENNLLEVLNSYIDERQVYLKNAGRYLDAIEKSYNSTKDVSCPVSSEYYLNHAWNAFKILKRVTVDWSNFLKVLRNDTNITNKIKSAVLAKHNGIFADWTVEKNDYKLIHIVRNLIKIPQTLSIKNEESKKKVRTQLREKILNQLKKLKESLKDFAAATYYVCEGQYTYWDDYRRLCRDEVVLNQKEINLKCQYVHNNNPSLLIGPFKQEQLHSDPQILMYHDVLSDGEIQRVQKLTSQQEMFMSQGKETFYRVAKVTWLDLIDLPKIKRRAQFMTNLTLLSAEAFQISVYGLAGQYEPHYDSGLEKSDPTNARISTILFYLNDVKKGGATVFPYLNLATTPKKGSAIFWYNIKPNYEIDTRTLHGGCPLYSGAKWVMNVWVKRSGEEFVKPCMAEHETSFIY